MAGIGSLGTATNSNLSNVGNNINTTGRSNMLLASTFVPNDDVLKKGDVDIKRHEICLTATHKGIQAYVPVISTDIVCDRTIGIEADKDYIRLPHTNPRLHDSVLDMTISTYYQDIGDARNEFELMLARAQISLHSYQNSTQATLDKCQDKLKFFRGELLHERHRRNAVFLITEDHDMHDVENHGGSWGRALPIADGDAVSEYNNIFHKFTPRVHTHQAMKNSSVYAIKIENDKMQNVFYVKMLLEMLCNFIVTTDEIKVFTPKSSNTAPITPPELRYAGLALTDAYMHPQNGDTAVTLNIFSAVTINNGPFDIVTNDELMWIHEVELPDFMADGLRRRRVVLDIEMLRNILNNENTTKTTIDEIYNTVTLASAKEPIIRQNNHLPGNPSRKTFLIAPCKRGFTLLQRTSILDHERRMARAISGAKAGKRLDMINGSCAHF